ncbi:MAG: PspC domain-containing protein [Bacteroidales bacterium]|nr:PspC domain-containing protein [Bacteroidales bacterium]
MKKLYRSNTDRKLCGVCGGLAEYFDIDPTIIRLIFIFLTLFGGGGLLIYLICALVIPKSPIQ